MQLRKIELKDWKAYVATSFDIPRCLPGKNVVLIGAKNGYGKTSLFEALVLGLFGQDGLPLIARAPFGLSSEARVKVSYNNFLAGAINQSAINQGRHQCSVSLTFEDDYSQPLILRRIWYFSSEGKHKPADEDMRIYRGQDERLVGCPTNEDEDEWHRAFVARELLPNNLANFFLFDGEQVQVLAERDMSAQVRTGIEGLLGIQILKELVVDLEKYATAKPSQVQGGSSPKELDRIRNDLLVFVSQSEKASTSLADVRAELDRLILRRDTITRELGALGAGSGESTVKERFEELNRTKRTIEEISEKLHSHVSDDLSLALTGESLRHRAIVRLNEEEIREDWEAGKRQGESGLDKFVDAMVRSFDELAPSLVETQRTDLVTLIKRNWDSLWHPAPANCASDFRHSYARGADRSRTRTALERVDRVSVADLSSLLEGITRARKIEHKLENEIAQLEGISPQIEIKANELKELNGHIDRLQAEKGRLERELEAVSAQLNQKRAEQRRYVESMDRAGPSIRRARWADTVKDALTQIVEEAVPDQIGAVAEAMTRAFTAMSHKNIVKKVEILPDCTVRLLSARGIDVRELALSAGEQQIFAQSLIAAIAEISQRDFPIVVDTPLGRLDDLHREGVLRHFTSRDGQVILLSTDTEVIGRYLEVVRPRLSATYHIVHSHDGAIGKSVVERGYFPGAGA